VGCTRVPGWSPLVVNRSTGTRAISAVFQTLYDNGWNIQVFFLNSGVRFDGHVNTVDLLGVN
jgi:hypothetical protein